MRRVVVTGMGLVTPLGSGVDHVWSQLVAGKSGAGTITRFDSSDYACHVACEVPFGDGTDGTFNPDIAMSAKERRRVDDFIVFAMAAADEALAQAGWVAETEEQQIRTGVTIGAGMGGLPGIEKTAIMVHENGPRKISPFYIPGRINNMAAGQVSIKHGFKGPNHSVVTACSTGAHSVGDASRMIMLDDADVMLAGGTEAVICAAAIGGFCAAKALSTGFNDEPTRASRPYDKDRDGFVMGEGAAMMVLEELEHAKARGATIYAEVTGYGLSGDAYHITSPAPDGNGGYRSMEMALKRAGITAADLDYINAHGTSTPVGDEIELGAVERLLGDAASSVSMSSTKSAIGHLLGAAGAVEAVFSVLALHNNVAPPTLNLENPSVDTKIDLVPLEAREREINAVLSNSFGFGGTNASLVFQSLRD